MSERIKIGSRGSQLALWQARWVKHALERLYPGLEVELVIIKTRGDKILDVPLAKIGGKGLFVKEIEAALLDGGIDLAVHSMKDMPAEIPAGLCIGPIPPREDPRDALITRKGLAFEDLPQGARVGTGSLRRGAQLRYARPDLQICALRGNLDTRLEKLATQDLDAIVLAAAGLLRLGLEKRITQYFDYQLMLPAVAQGALCIEMRRNDARISALTAPLNHEATRIVVMAERAFLNFLQGGCQVPLAGHGQIEGSVFQMDGLVAALEGNPCYRCRLKGPLQDAQKTAVEVAKTLLSQGAAEILAALADEGE